LRLIQESEQQVLRVKEFKTTVAGSHGVDAVEKLLVEYLLEAGKLKTL